MTEVKPLKKNVLIAENRTTVKSESGIILDSAMSAMDSKTGTVLAIGDAVTEVKVGDVVYLEWPKGKIVKINDAQRVMIEEQYIVGVLEQ